LHTPFPESTKLEIERYLGSGLRHIAPLQGGTHGRTYLIGTASGRWVARLLLPHRAARTVLSQKLAAAAGVPVPNLVAYCLLKEGEGRCCWCVEEFVEGEEFYPERTDFCCAAAISADLGRQLKRLHGVRLDGFGYLSGEPPRGQYATWEEWVASEQTNAEEAVELSGVGGRGRTRLEEAYVFLQTAFQGEARLCHGDFAGDNLLVRGRRLVAALDWENAMACDPAHDVAYWFLWHGDEQLLNALLSAYAPENPELFRERVLAHYLLLAAQFIVWYTGEGDERGTDFCRNILAESLSPPDG